MLQEISLAKHSIRDEGAQYISECLLSAKNSSLASLDLSGNQIGISGGKHLALLLANNGTIRKLSLAGNAIGDEGARAIAVALRDHNSTLTSLDLSNNGIGEPGLVAIAEALMQGTTPLAELRLWGNTFGQRSAGSFHRLFNEGVSRRHAVGVCSASHDLLSPILIAMQSLDRTTAVDSTRPINHPNPKPHLAITPAIEILHQEHGHLPEREPGRVPNCTGHKQGAVRGIQRH